MRGQACSGLAAVWACLSGFAMLYDTVLWTTATWSCAVVQCAVACSAVGAPLCPRPSAPLFNPARLDSTPNPLIALHPGRYSKPKQEPLSKVVEMLPFFKGTSLAYSKVETSTLDEEEEQFKRALEKGANGGLFAVADEDVEDDVVLGLYDDDYELEDELSSGGGSGSGGPGGGGGSGGGGDAVTGAGRDVMDADDRDAIAEMEVSLDLEDGEDL